MTKQMIMFKCTIHGMENVFYFESGCSTEVAKLAALEVLKWIGNIEDAQKIAQEQKELEQNANPNPDIKPEV